MTGLTLVKDPQGLEHVVGLDAPTPYERELIAQKRISTVNGQVVCGHDNLAHGFPVAQRDQAIQQLIYTIFVQKLTSGAWNGYVWSPAQP